MSNPSVEDHNHSTYLKFSDELVAEVRQTIDKEFEASAFRWLKFTFQIFARLHIRNHFAEYPIVSEKIKIEEVLEKIKVDLERLQRELRSVLKTGEKLQKKYAKEIKAISNEIKRLYDAIARSYKSQKLAAANIRQERIEEWYHYRLKDYPIKPSTIPGIGPTRVSALDYVDIRTAADIVPENTRKGKDALYRVRGARPSSEWRDLEDWCEKLKQRMSRPIIKEPTKEEIQEVCNEHELRRSELEKSIDKKKKQLADPHNLSSPIGQQVATNARTERQIREQIKKLDRQLSSIEDDLRLYKFITSDKLLEEILKV